jgi:hypothetical protein
MGSVTVLAKFLFFKLATVLQQLPLCFQQHELHFASLYDLVVIRTLCRELMMSIVILLNGCNVRCLACRTAVGHSLSFVDAF